MKPIWACLFMKLSMTNWFFFLHMIISTSVSCYFISFPLCLLKWLLAGRNESIGKESYSNICCQDSTNCHRNCLSKVGSNSSLAALKVNNVISIIWFWFILTLFYFSVILRHTERLLICTCQRWFYLFLVC